MRKRFHRLLLFVTFWALAAPAVIAESALAPQVILALPTPQKINAPPNAVVEVWFDVPLNPATINANSIHVFGRWSGPASGTFQLLNGDTQVRFIPNDPFFAGESVTVSVCRDVENTSGAPMNFGYAWNFWVKTEVALLDLFATTQINIGPSEPWIQSYGAYAGDLNNDGWSDLAIPNERSNDVRVFLNDGAGVYSTFTKTVIPGGNKPSTNAGADFNRDGEIDLAVGNSQNSQVSILLGDGTGTLTFSSNYTANTQVRGLSVLDLDGDGATDIATANRVGEDVSLLLNSGTGTFGAATAVNPAAGGETACAAADINEDGIMDLFVGGFYTQHIVVLLGDGNGGMTIHTTVSAGGSPWMVAAGDVNNDGHVDVVCANASENNAGVLLGDGTGNLGTVTTYATGLFPLAIDLGDIDGDGDLEMVTSNYNGENWSVFENTGGSFSLYRNYRAGDAASFVILHDRDNDGDMDMSGIDEIFDRIYIFTNEPSLVGNESPSLTGARLLQNQPNPFNPQTTISFDLPGRMQVTLGVYDVAGRHVVTLADGVFDPGVESIVWNATDADGRPVGSGVYFYRLRTPETTISKKMLLLK